MKVLLLERMKRLGNIGSIVEVNKGYARNYLLTRKKAMRLTKENKEKIESDRLNIEKTDSEKKTLALQNKEKINGSSLLIIRQAGDDGKLYGSVTNKDIVRSLSSKFSATTTPENITLKEKIKTVGIYEVDIELHAGVETKLKVIVARSEKESLLYDKTEDNAGNELEKNFSAK